MSKFKKLYENFNKLVGKGEISPCDIDILTDKLEKLPEEMENCLKDSGYKFNKKGYWENSNYMICAYKLGYKVVSKETEKPDFVLVSNAELCEWLRKAQVKIETDK